MPGWASGDFVDLEQWTIFVSPQLVVWWVESGQTAGNGIDCCTMHPFWATEKADGYHEAIAPWAYSGEPAFEAWSWNGGLWEVYWNGSAEQAFSPLPRYSNLVEAGLEVAANTKPSVAGFVDTAVWWPDNSYHNWGRQEWKADTGLCIRGDGRAGRVAMGNVAVGTC